jgi:peptide-methionine (S)-S-oxide reductase
MFITRASIRRVKSSNTPRRWSRNVWLLLAVLGAVCQASARASEPATLIPSPVVDVPLSGNGSQTVVLAGGCFWGVQAVFQHVKGVSKALSGYAGGSRETAIYEVMSSGRTGHAEAVQVTFDPRQISYGRILQIYFSVAHDPTQLNRQGPDTGTQYRSAIFYKDATQKNIAEAYVAQLIKASVFKRPIVTQLNQLTAFYPAEAHHQDYATLHPTDPYIVYNDLPKVNNLKWAFSDLYRDKPILIVAAH